MFYIDLVQLLKENSDLKNVYIHGRVVKELPRPTNIFNSVRVNPNGVFVQMDVLALGLDGYKSQLQQRGVYNPSSLYMVNGSICTFIDKSQLVIPDWYTLNGDLRFGAKASTDYIILLNYKKISNNWILDCSSCDDMDIGNWLKGTPL